MSLLRALASDDPTAPVLRVIPGTQPAAGADWTITVPGASTWQLVAVTAKLVTDANAANRTPGFQVTDGTTTLYRLPIGVAITATLTTQVSWVAAAGFTNTTLVGATLGVSIPPIILPPGFTFGTATTNVQVGDQWSLINATVIEVFTGDVETERAIAEKILDRLVAIEQLAEDGG